MTAAVCLRQLPGARRPCRTVLDVATNGLGKLTATCPRCERQRHGRCWECGATRENPGARALFCARCRDASRAAANARHERSATAKANARRRDRARNRTPERQAQRRAWVAANPDRVKRWKRKAALNPTPRQRERERYHNSRPERIQAKRAQARARYYAQHPERPRPTCRACGAAISWTPPGRPPVRCDACVPPSVARKRKRPASANGAV